MPRRPRIHVPGGLYHAILRGNHRQAIFEHVDDYLIWEGLLAAYLPRYEARLHAYCWMPNHVHLAVQVGEVPLGRLMQAIASTYARRKQRGVPTTGHLFERRYRAKLVAAETYLLALVRYIHCNPLRAGLVRDPAAYVWSSHRAYLGKAAAPWLAIEPTLTLLRGRDDGGIEAYRRLMAEDPDSEEIEAIRCVEHRRRPSGREARPSAWNRGTGASDPASLDQIVNEVAETFRVDAELLASRERSGVLVQARIEIARRALASGTATLTVVAARLGRAPSSLSEQLSRDRDRRIVETLDDPREPKP